MNEHTKDNFNIEPLVIEIKNIINKGLKNILNNYVDRFNLLEETHHQIMSLPSVKNELTKNCNESKMNSASNSINEKLDIIPENKNINISDDIKESIRQLVSDEYKANHKVTFSLINSISNQIRELDMKLSNLKINIDSSNKKEIIDLTVSDIKIKTEPVEKENIK